MDGVIFLPQQSCGKKITRKVLKLYERSHQGGDRGDEDDHRGPDRKITLELVVGVALHQALVVGQADQEEKHQRQGHGVDALGDDHQLEQRNAREQVDHRRHQQLPQEDDVKSPALVVGGIQAARQAEELGEGVGRGKRHDHDAHEAGVEDAHRKQRARQLAGEGLDRQGRLLARDERDLVDEQGGSGGHDHEEREEIGQEGAPVGLGLGVGHVLGVDLLVEGKAADEELAPGGDGGAQHAHADDQEALQVIGGEIHPVRVDQVAQRQAPIGFGHDGRNDVGQVKHAGQQHDASG